MDDRIIIYCILTIGLREIWHKADPILISK